MAESRSDASSTLRHSGPTVSNLAQSGTTPSSDSKPLVVLRPTRLFHAAGIRTEPPVSEPIPAAASPKATEVAAPEEEPPGASAGSFTLGGVAVTGFRPRPENANSVIWVLPRQTSPARVAFSNTTASLEGTRPLSNAEPASVTVPAVSKRSFQLIGTPSSHPRRTPFLARARAVPASARARSRVVRAYISPRYSCLSIASRKPSASSTGSIFPASISRPSAAALIFCQPSIIAYPLSVSRSLAPISAMDNRQI